MTEQKGIYEIDELGACEKLLDELRSEQADCAVLAVKYTEAIRALTNISRMIEGRAYYSEESTQVHVDRVLFDLIQEEIAEVVNNDSPDPNLS
jgi:hypothetical protein